MKPDTRNIAVTLLLIASSLGIGRTGFVWHERLEEQAGHISELENQILEERESRTVLARELEVLRRSVESSMGGSQKAVILDADSDDRAPVAVQTPSSVDATPVPDIDVAFLQSAMNQLQLLQNQQTSSVTPKQTTKTTVDTPVKRSRTTRAS